MATSFVNARREWAGLAVALVLTLGMGLYVRWVMMPIEEAHYAAAGRAMDIGDLYPRWHGARELLLHGRDPYGPEVSREIQVAYYGHVLDLAGVDKGRDQQRFAYPVYVVFILAPTVRMEFSDVQWVMRWALGIVTAGGVLLWLRALSWRPSAIVISSLIAMTLSSPALAQALRLQQLAMLVAFCLAGCAALVSRGKFFWAGCLLAGATIKPQLALLPVIWLFLWASGDWKNRQRLVRGFVVMMALLMGAGQILLPGWLGEFVRGLLAYSHYAGMSILLEMYVPPAVARPLAAALVVVLLIFCWRWRRDSADEARFFVRFSLILAVSIVALPPLLPPFNQVLLMPGMLAVIHSWNTLWKRGWMVRGVCCCGIAAVVWPGIAGGGLALTHLVAPGVSLERVWDWPFLLCFLLPPIVAALLAILSKDLSGAAEAVGVESAHI